MQQRPDFLTEILHPCRIQRNSSLKIISIQQQQTGCAETTSDVVTVQDAIRVCTDTDIEDCNEFVLKAVEQEKAVQEKTIRIKQNRIK